MSVFNVPVQELFVFSILLLHSSVPSQPSLSAKEIFRADPGANSDHVELFHPASSNGLQHKEKSLIMVLQKNNQMEVVLEECDVTGVSFFLGDNQVEPQSPSREEQTCYRSCQIQTPVEVHSTAGAGFENNCELQESITLNPEEKTAVHSDTEEQSDHPSVEEKLSSPDSDFKDGDGSTEKKVLDINGLERFAEVKDSEEEKEPEIIEQIPFRPEINVDGAPQLERRDDIQMDHMPAHKEVDDKDQDGHSVLSSNESIIKVSDEESICDEVEDLNEDENYMKTSGEEMPLWPHDDSIRNIIDLHLNGCPQEMEHSSMLQDVLQAEELQSKADISDLGQSVIVNTTVAGGDQIENSDFSIIETSWVE